MRENAKARDAAVILMRNGDARVAEIARCLETSNQVVAYWAKAAKINVAHRRERRVMQLLRSHLR